MHSLPRFHITYVLWLQAVDCVCKDELLSYSAYMLGTSIYFYFFGQDANYGQSEKHKQTTFEGPKLNTEHYCRLHWSVGVMPGENLKLGNIIGYTMYQGSNSIQNLNFSLMYIPLHIVWTQVELYTKHTLKIEERGTIMFKMWKK